MLKLDSRGGEAASSKLGGVSDESKKNVASIHNISYKKDNKGGKS